MDSREGPVNIIRSCVGNPPMKLDDLQPGLRHMKVMVSRITGS